MNEKKKTNGQKPLLFWYLLLAIPLVLTLAGPWFAQRGTQHIPYSQFLELLNKDQIQEVTVSQNMIEAKLKKPMPDGTQTLFTTRVDPSIAETLAAHNVKFDGAVESNWLRDLLSWVVPTVLFAVMWIFLLRGAGGRQGLGGFMSVGKSKAKIYAETDIKVSFADVAGVDEAKEELQEIVRFLKDPKSYGRLGAHVPKGVLLVGPPGTGKTLLARAVAGEAGVPFFSISGSEFVEMFVGVGAARVRDLFAQARSSAPCIIFIDELDALGRARGIVNIGGGADEKEQTLNQLLAELDGFDPSEGVVLLAATNRPEILDPALLRAGRFDLQVLVDRPDKIGRVEILRVHIKKIITAPEVSLDAIAALTPGFTGADLATLVNEAALLATRRSATAATMDDFTRALERIVAGLEKRSRVLNAKERKVVAYHEMGHALVAASLPSADAVHKVSIIPRGVGALGYTLQRPTEDRFLMTRQELADKMTVLLGGRAAEMLVFQELSTGASDDLDKATEIARQMVVRYGMIKDLGQMVYEPQRHAFLGDVYGTSQARQYSEETAREIDCAVRQLIEEAFQAATGVLSERRDDLEKGASLLLEKETVTDAEFPALAKGERPALKPAAAVAVMPARSVP
ncbi:MAG: ATP-dependent zinc metalloprotease FtsH [Alphaproteobacteria bacterium]